MATERTLIVPGRFESLAAISDFITQAARDAGFGDDDVFHIQMAVDEACSNVVEHAYGSDRRGDINLRCRIDNGGDLQVEIRDRGRPFDPDQVPLPLIEPDSADLDAMRVGGLGLFFMRKLMDEVTFEFDAESGNCLIMVKRRPK